MADEPNFKQMQKDRVKQLQAVMKEQGFGALFLAEGANVEVKLCSACHLDPEKAETPSMRQMSLSKNPFHKLCIDCHKAEAKGPKTCNDCHKK